MQGQNFVLVVVAFAVIAIVKLCMTIISLFKERWKFLALTKGMKAGRLKDPHLLYGNIHEISRIEENRIQELIDRVSECGDMTRFWFGGFHCVIMPLNPEYIKILTASADPKDKFVYGLLEPWLGNGLLISDGKKWTRHRRLLTPAFHFEILRPYVKISVDSTKTFLDKLAALNGTSVDVWPHVSLLTLDTLLKCSFSRETNCQLEENIPYIESVYKMAELIVSRALFPPYHNDFIYRWSPEGRQFYSHVRRVHATAEATIKERKHELAQKGQREEDTKKEPTRKRKYMDFLDVLIEARDEDGNGLGNLEIREEVDTFMFEGHDTTASGVSWCLYNMARFPEHQQKCREEVNDLLKNKNKEELEWDDLNQLPFLTMFIKESLRFHPPVPEVGRTLEKDVKLPNGLLLPKGSHVQTPVIATHHNPRVWNDPEVFDPYRFSTENNAKRHSHSFIPFSAGPRNCIGQRFAMNEIKIVAAMTIRRFLISADKDRTPRWILRLVLRSSNGIHLRFTPV